VLHEHGVGNVGVLLRVFKQKLLDTAGQNWHIDATNKCTLNLYSLYKSSLDIEAYVLVDMHWKHRAAFARFRCGSHKLAMERGRSQHYDRWLRFL